LNTDEYNIGLVNELLKLPNETEWVEFKHNNSDPEMIGEYISALGNSAALLGKVKAYVVWGVDDSSHEVLGTIFDPSTQKVGNEEIENWLLRLLQPKIHFRFLRLMMNEMRVVLLEIDAAFRSPIQFKGQEFIRIGSYKKKLKEHPEKERELWRVFDQTPFEKCVAVEHADDEDVLTLLDYGAYFDLLDIPLPDGRSAILEALKSDDLIAGGGAGKWNITNLGAILFAKKLEAFPSLKRKSVRVVQYEDRGRTKTLREMTSTKGYASGFEGLIGFLKNILPRNEVMGQALRKEVPMYPDLAIRELVANILIHQDFSISGTGPMIEIFSDRIEFTNPGAPLVDIARFIDSPPKSRNELLASLMRRFRICEERGSGIDKVVSEVELFQLPAPLFEVPDGFTRTVLFAHRAIAKMDKSDRVRACYLHACLRWVIRDQLTNASLRKRFGVTEQNKASVSRYIREALEEGVIVPVDDKAPKKLMKYVPFWAKNFN
jgi:predicted HTH transcriptional regulator